MFKSRQEIDRAWLLTYHETGRLINEHILRNKDRADYGAKVFTRLAEDTGTNKRTLEQCAQFQRYFPIASGRSQLGWAHYRLLCQVDNEAQRQTLMAETIKRHWTSTELETRVRALNAIDVTPDSDSFGVSPAPKLLTPKRGKVGVCKVIAVDGGLVVDLGFASYLDLPGDTERNAGDFVKFAAAGHLTPSPAATKADLFTYHAAVLKVVDGDTLWVKIYLRPGQWVKHKLRLRDLDCPEMSTPEGKAANRFVDALVAGATAMTVCTTKPDKYDRYLADVFLTTGDGEEVFLNNALLTSGHAVIKRAWEFGDWGAG